MKLRIVGCALIALVCSAAHDDVAARLAKQAREAQNSGQFVRAYLLYAEAAARQPNNPSYRANRDALTSIAKLLTKAQIENADISADIKAAEQAHRDEGPEPPIQLASARDWERDPELQPLPHLQANAGLATFDLRGDAKSLFPQVASAYGIRAVLDPELMPPRQITFRLENADFLTAMKALTAATHTFLFPISEHDIFVASDTPIKRSELEPQILLTVKLPNAMDQKELIDAAGAVRAVLRMRSIGWDSETRTVLIRDRVTRARAAKSLLEALLLPRGQVSLEVELLTVDSDRSYHYGVSLPTSYQVIDFGHIGHFQSILPSIANAMSFLAFGGGATLFGVGLADATIFATYSNSFTTHLYDATVVVADGQKAELHVGDKFPIPQTLYTGFQQSAPSIYNPVPELTLEDLGIVLKVAPHVNGDGDISLDIETEFKELGTLSIDTVPSINQREFKGSVRLREDEWAVLAGINARTQNVTRTGLVGLSQIPGLNQLLSENARDDQGVQMLLVIKPTITRLPMSSWVSPQYLLGPLRGNSVIL